MTAGSRIDSVGTQVLYMQGMEGRKVVSARQRFWSVCRADLPDWCAFPVGWRMANLDDG